MEDRTTEKQSGALCPCGDGCPVGEALASVGGRWKLRIICTLYVDGTPVGTVTGKTVFRFTIPLLGEHLIRAEAGDVSDTMCIRRVGEPDESYIFNKAAASVANWFDSEEIDPACFSVSDTLGEIRSNPQAGAIIDAMMAKGASERGDVADAVKDNPALQRMMGRMTMLSLLKQGGADEQSIKQLNRILQGIRK
jgi:beta-galactosidase